MKEILITGGTGFVGQAILKRLALRNDIHVRLLVRPQSTAPAGLPNSSASATVRPAPGNILEPETLRPALEGVECIIHLVGIIRETGRQTFERVHVEGTGNVLRAAVSSGVKRFLHMSAENTRPDAPDRYHTTKFEAEELVRSSGLDWTIFRPSMMFGPRDQNFNELARIIRLAPVIPVIGDGQYIWQPISVHDVAEIFVRALDLPVSVGKTYELRGPEKFTYNEILDLLMEVMGVRKPKVHLPASFMSPIVALMNVVPSAAPITPEQMKMLLDRTPPPPENFSADMPIRLKRLVEGLQEYLKP